MAESKLKFTGFIGPSYTARVGRYERQRTVNMYLEMDQSPQPTGKSAEPTALIGFPGLKLIETIGVGPIRAIYVASNSYTLFVVSGSQVWKITNDSTGAMTAPVLIGNILTTTGYVSVADNGLQVMFVDGAYGYYSSLTGSPTLQLIVSANFYPSAQVTSQDGYFILVQTGTAYFFISDLYAVTFPPLNQANKSGASDVLTGVISNNRQLYLMGRKTIETWWDSGASGSTPFARQDGQFSEVGCLSAASIQRLMNTFIWVGSSAEGDGVVYMMQNQLPVRISNHAVEFSIQNSSGNIDNSTAYTWQVEGHYFYALNVPGLNTTWVYDVSTQQWVEQQSNIKGITGRHLAQCHANFDGFHIVGDYTNGNIYRYDYNTYTDNGNPIMRIRQSPHIAEGLNRCFYKLLEIDFSPGVGTITGTANAVNPQVFLEISNDGGETFGKPMSASIGKIGKFLTRARWQRLGSSRDRIFRVSCSDPVKFDLLTAQLDMEVGYG